MTLVFFIILTIAWLVIFFPKVVRARRSSPLPAADLFKKRLELLAPRPADRGRWVMVPQAPEAARTARRRSRERRKRVLHGSLLLCAATFAAALAGISSWMWFLGALAFLVTYVVLLVGLRRQQQSAVGKVAPLPAFATDQGTRRRATGASS